MRIYFSSRVLQPKRSGGIAAYFLGVVEAIAARPESTDEIHLGLSLHGGEFGKALPHPVQHHWLAGLDPSIQAESERALIDRLKPDWVVYFVADPLNYYGGGKFRVATCLADLQHLHFPYFFPAADRLARDQAFGSAVGLSDLVFTLSRFCQLDIAKTFGLAESAIRVVSPALRGLFLGGPAPAADIAQTREKFGLPANFAIFPGNFWHHKNHARLLRAFSQWHRNWKSQPGNAVASAPYLVLVGSPVEGDPKLQALLREGKREGWLSTLGFVSEHELHALVSGARCLVFPSVFEGFGIPVLEALAMGRPVACSRSTSLLEVGGALPHYFDPEDEESMLAALQAAWAQETDEEFRRRADAQVQRFQYAHSGDTLRQALGDFAAPRAPRQAAEYGAVDEPVLVSIVTPSFQHAAFLPQCIESVLGQDYPHLEYAVFDGGSTDGSVEILRGYGDRFHWESGPDGGQTHAINKGLRRSRGQILAYLNSDDFLLPGAVSAVVKARRLNPSVDVFYGKAYWTDEQGQFTSPYPTRPFESDAFRADCFICQPATFWQRRVTERFGLFDEQYQYAMDYEYWQRILAGGGLISFVDQFLACSRAHEATKTRTQRGRVFKDIFSSQWKLWGAVHRDWWEGLLHHLADERRGMWPRLIPSRRSARQRLADRLSRLVRNPFASPGRGRARRRQGGFFPDGWVAPTCWIDLHLANPTDLILEGSSPTANEIRVVAGGRERCRVQAHAGEPFRLAWQLSQGRHRIYIRAAGTRRAGQETVTAFQLNATNLFLH